MRTILLTIVLAAAALPASAQEAGCTYSECAIRVERWRLLRGLSGEVVGGLRGLTPDVDVLLEGPPDAARSARTVIDSHRKAELYGLGAGVWLLAVSPSGTSYRGDPWVSRDALAVTIPLTAFAMLRSARHTRTRDHALGRAVWAYNRAFVPDPGPGELPESRLDGAAWNYAPLVLGALGGVAGLLADEDGSGPVLGLAPGGLVGGIVGLVQLAVTERR